MVQRGTYLVIINVTLQLQKVRMCAEPIEIKTIKHNITCRDFRFECVCSCVENRLL